MGPLPGTKGCCRSVTLNLDLDARAGRVALSSPQTPGDDLERPPADGLGPGLARFYGRCNRPDCDRGEVRRLHRSAARPDRAFSAPGVEADPFDFELSS